MPYVCGDAGGRRLEDGSPCQQNTAEGRRCVHHPDLPPAEAAAHRSAVARRGGESHKLALVIDDPILNTVQDGKRLMGRVIGAGLRREIPWQLVVATASGVRAVAALDATAARAELRRVEQRMERLLEQLLGGRSA